MGNDQPAQALDVDDATFTQLGGMKAALAYVPINCVLTAANRACRFLDATSYPIFHAVTSICTAMAVGAGW